jgi:TatD DNase family protein
MVIDSHCHLHDPAFAALHETLRVSLAHDVWGVVAVGCDPETNAKTLAAAAAAPKAVWACLGFHPDWAQLTDEDLEKVEAQVSRHHARIVGIGEIGLPWYSLESAADAATLMARGRARLGRLLGLAARWDLPVALHAPHGAAGGEWGQRLASATVAASPFTVDRLCVVHSTLSPKGSIYGVIHEARLGAG